MASKHIAHHQITCGDGHQHRHVRYLPLLWFSAGDDDLLCAASARADWLYPVCAPHRLIPCRGCAHCVAHDAELDSVTWWQTIVARIREAGW